MGSAPYFLKQNNTVVLRFFFMLLFFCSIPDKANFCSNDSTLVLPSYMSPSNDIHSLETLNLDGYLSFHNIDHAAKDFGNMYRVLPLAVLYPESVSDISATIKRIFEMGSFSKLTVAARGHGHSLQGQAQAHQGIVINMESLQGPKMHVNTGGQRPYVDVSGGELWINVLHETLKYGFAPKTWTDYLHLTIGGTLSNAGISGQAFKHGPQIDNVYQLEVVTGKGEVVTCSTKQNTDLFHGVLGGLGQFGIITRARISLEPAPKMVKWIRVLYSDFSKFTNDQEQLISSENSFDYIEGLVIINRTGLVKKWRSSFDPKYPLQASQFVSEGKTLYCLEIAKYFDPADSDSMNQKTESLLSELSYTPSTLFMAEVSYVEFLDRVYVSEKKLQEKNLRDIPHPWLNLLIPKTKIFEFAQEVFGKILAGSSNGPILIYPVNTSKWDKRTSLVTPGEDIVYLVAFLYSAVPSSTGKNGLDYILGQNQRILDFCSSARLGVKQYLPHYLSQEEWEAHFGSKWLLFEQRKLTYDPLAMLAPGQRIFQRKQSSHDTSYPSHLSLPR